MKEVDYFCVKLFVHFHVFFLLDKHVAIELFALKLCMGTLKILPNSCLKWLYHLTLPPGVCENSCCFTSSPILGIFSLFNYSPSSGRKMVFWWFYFAFS